MLAEIERRRRSRRHRQTVGGSSDCECTAAGARASVRRIDRREAPDGYGRGQEEAKGSHNGPQIFNNVRLTWAGQISGKRSAHRNESAVEFAMREAACRDDDSGLAVVHIHQAGREQRIRDGAVHNVGPRQRPARLPFARSTELEAPATTSALQARRVSAPVRLRARHSSALPKCPRQSRRRKPTSYRQVDRFR